jgi:hypothetical protein
MGIFKTQSLQLPLNKYTADMAKARSEIPGLETDITNLQAEYRQIEENVKKMNKQ